MNLDCIIRNYQLIKKSVILCHTLFKMANKNKQYRIEKGLLLFTQPRSPYFYGKIRLKGKYHTKSFSPISDFNAAREKLFEWKDELMNSSENVPSQSLDRKEYTDFKEPVSYTHLTLPTKA